MSNQNLESSSAAVSSDFNPKFNANRTANYDLDFEILIKRKGKLITYLSIIYFVITLLGCVYYLFLNK